MAGADDIMRSVGEIQDKGRGLSDTLSGGAASGLGAARGVAAFFHNTDNLLALAVCLIAVIGLYRLLRSENIIPASRRTGGGSFLTSFLVRRLALRLMVFAVVAAIGLALATGQLAGILAALKHFF